MPSFTKYRPDMRLPSTSILIVSLMTTVRSEAAQAVTAGAQYSPPSAALRRRLPEHPPALERTAFGPCSAGLILSNICGCVCRASSGSSVPVLVQLKQERLRELDICEAGDEVASLYAKLREGVRLQCETETQHRRKDGTSHPVNAYLSAVVSVGPNQRTFLAVTVDVSARPAAEDALRAAQLERGVARLQRWARWQRQSRTNSTSLAAIVSNGNAGVRWLDRPEPNLEKVRSAFGALLGRSRNCSGAAGVDLVRN